MIVKFKPSKESITWAEDLIRKQGFTGKIEWVNGYTLYSFKTDKVTYILEHYDGNILLGYFIGDVYNRYMKKL